MFNVNVVTDSKSYAVARNGEKVPSLGGYETRQEAEKAAHEYMLGLWVGNARKGNTTPNAPYEEFLRAAQGLADPLPSNWDHDE